MDPSEFINTYRTAHLALHRLWTKSVGTDSYHKPDWMELERAFSMLGRAVAQAIGYSGPLVP